MKRSIEYVGILALLGAGLLFPLAGSAHSAIDGLTGSTFDLAAKDGFLTTPDGNSLYTWGYSDGANLMQYPGPTLIVNQGDTITVNFKNELGWPSSIVFPGQANVQAAGVNLFQDGLLTVEALPGGEVTYSFVAKEPGTYHYHSGTRPEIQVEMGLSGALIVRPSGFDPNNPKAYDHAGSSYDREYLFFLSEMDPRIHEFVFFLGPNALEGTDYLSNYVANYWFLNGRLGPDTLAADRSPWLPHQPYNCLPRMHPGEKLLMRVVAAGRDLHPFHHHGNHATVIAENGRPLLSTPGLPNLDLSYEVFTIQSVPGETVDAIFEWTGEDMGWDIYGHAPGDPLQPFEDPDDHGKSIPVTLPEQQDLTFGGFYSGSPFLGDTGRLPPGEGGLNPNGAFTFMWHSHTERELVNFDIFPGGMLTILFIEHWDVEIKE